MNWYEHWDLKGKHAFLSASNHHWLNYTDDKLDTVFINMQNKERGTRLHAFANEAIELGEHLRGSRRSISMYVNDAIGFGMRTEQILYYSENAFGTADAICFSDKKKFLRIHDLKTGETPGSEHQLFVYDALFCLEYNINPHEIDREHRIYQYNDDPLIFYPEPEIITIIMDKIITFDKRIEKLKNGV